ncbi:hypothetical protein A225_3886 [Klebsiella michiganensis E718]|nr:hypothetical protein A225_3886 [Klebsiella michiganensis E718]
MVKKILLLFIILCMNNVSFASVKIWFCPNDSGFITDKQLEKNGLIQEEISMFTSFIIS